MPTYYTYKWQVPLASNQVLDFRTGFGYYARDVPPPTTAAPPPASPTSPERYYTYKEQVPLASNQVLDFRAGFGYYARTVTAPPPSSQPPSGPSAQPQPAPQTPGDAAFVPTPRLQQPATTEAARTKPASPAKQPTPTAKQPVATKPATPPVVARKIKYYTYADDVPLEPGETLAFTAGKGYYAKNATDRVALHPAQPRNSAAPPSERKDSPKRREADDTPTRPAHQTDLRSKPDTTYYTFKRDVPLKHGQAIGFTPGKGYYARDITLATPNPEHHRRLPIAERKLDLQTDRRPDLRADHSSAKGILLANGGSGIRHYTHKYEVPLQANQRLGFTPGKGYYARDLITIQSPGHERSRQAKRGNAPEVSRGGGKSVPGRRTPSQDSLSAVKKPSQQSAESIVSHSPESPHSTMERLMMSREKTPVGGSYKKQRPYDRQAAVAYARQWAGEPDSNDTSKYNPKYEVSRGGAWKWIKDGLREVPLNDCTNFTSQALHAGGWIEDEAWKYTKPGYVINYASGFATKVGGASPAWENVQLFADYAIESGRAKYVALDARHVKPGDIILADWSGNRPGSKDFAGDHTMIVTEVKRGEILVASHGRNRADVPLLGSESSETIQGVALRSGRTPTFMALHIIGSG